MQLNLPPDLEILINKRLSSGAYTSAEDVLRRALEAQDAEESWTNDERRAIRGQTLRQDIRDGMGSGPSKPFDPQSIKRIARQKKSSHQAE
jgi:Arc/MetJ-type ribon-helix-helix transcriptional regulator